jgi:hypothetical protein
MELAKQLRIGNYIEQKKDGVTDSIIFKNNPKIGAVEYIDYKSTGINKVVIGITGKGWSSSSPIIDQFSFISLTEEWLLKFGFNKVKKNVFDIKILNNHLGLFLNGHRWAVSISNIDQNKDYYSRMTRYIDSVHEIQNLYFVLTGEELTINQL